MIIQKSLQQENIVKLLLKLERADADLKVLIEEEIKRRNLSEQEIQRAQKEYANFRKYVKKEESKPLPWYLKVSCIVVPFSASKTYGGEDLPERDWEMLSSTHNTRQKQEITTYSIIGIIVYVIIAIIAMLFFIILKLIG